MISQPAHHGLYASKQVVRDFINITYSQLDTVIGKLREETG